MTRSLRVLTLIFTGLFLVSVSVMAAGNSYQNERPKWNGSIKVVDAATGSPIDGAFVVGRNVPSGTYSFGIHLINRDDGRTFDKTNLDGMARAFVLPLGTVTVWKPGYAPLRSFFTVVQTDTSLPSPDASGIVTVSLVKTATDEARAKALAQAVEWMEPGKRVPFISLGGRARRSATLRNEAREAFIAEGWTAE